MKKIFVNLVMLLIGILFAAIIGENLAGYYLKKSPLGRTITYLDSKSVSSSLHQKLSIVKLDQGLGVNLNPGAKDILVTSDFAVTYSINSQGIRDKEIPLEKPNVEFRILALGESTVFGEGVNYGKRLTEVIEQALGNVEVINMGVQGFGLDQSFLHLKRNGFQFNPDAGIVFIFASDYLERCLDITVRGSTTPKPRFILSDDKNRLILQDIGYARKEFEAQTSSYKKNMSGVSGVKDTEYSTQSNKLITNHSSILALLNYYIKKQKIDKGLRDGDIKFFHDVTAICSWQQKRREHYKEEDFERLIFLLMSEYQKIFNEHNVDFTVVNMNNAKLSYVERVCKELDISYLDLSEIIMRASKSEQLKFIINTHYNDTYHRIVGEYVSNYLNKKYNLERISGYRYQYLGKFNSRGK